MFLVAGLGNPDREYLNTRHNIGFIMLDLLFDFESLAISKKFDSIYSSANFGGQKIILQKPLTYMNLSGKSVLGACTFYKIKPENVIIIHDDLDLKMGEVKFKIGGGNAGHNGLKSIDGAIGVNYWRIRVGIDRPVLKEMVSSYVLSPFGKEEFEALNQAKEKVKLALEKILQSAK